YPHLHNFFAFFFFINATATTELYTLSLHDALPISIGFASGRSNSLVAISRFQFKVASPIISGNNAALFTITNLTKGAEMWYTIEDRKSTRLNSSHRTISYAVFCLKKKKKKKM